MKLFTSFLHKLFTCAEPKKEPTFLYRINFPIGLYYLQYFRVGRGFFASI